MEVPSVKRAVSVSTVSGCERAHILGCFLNVAVSKQPGWLVLAEFLRIVFFMGYSHHTFSLFGSVLRKVNSAIHQIVIFSNFLNMFSNW